MSNQALQQFDLKDGFNKSGLYVGRNKSLQDNFYVQFNASNNNNAPVAVILHGYRGDCINGTNNIALASTLHKQGFATAQINHAGFDHYGKSAAPKTADLGTLASCIEDCSTVLKAIGKDKPAIIIANSYSINIAMESLSNTVKHVIAVSPFPDFVNMAVTPALDAGDDMSKMVRGALDQYGFFIHEQISPVCKLTHRFIKEASAHSLLSSAIDENGHKPTIHFVRSQNDARIPAGLVDKFSEHLKSADFRVDDTTIVGDTHEITPELLQCFETMVQKISIAPPSRA